MGTSPSFSASLEIGKQSWIQVLFFRCLDLRLGFLLIGVELDGVSRVEMSNRRRTKIGGVCKIARSRNKPAQLIGTYSSQLTPLYLANRTYSKVLLG